MCDPVSYAVIRTGMAYQEYQSDKAEAKYIITEKTRCRI